MILGVLCMFLFLGVNAQTSFENSNTDSKVEITTIKKESFEWVSKVYDFGEIKQGIPQVAEFELKNTGEKPIIILNAKASCGCTNVKYPKEPILPGKSAKVTTTYNAAARGMFNKTVTVHLSTKDNVHVLKLKGTVVKKD